MLLMLISIIEMCITLSISNVNFFKDSYIDCEQGYNNIRSFPGKASSNNNDQTLCEASELDIVGV